MVDLRAQEGQQPKALVVVELVTAIQVVQILTVLHTQDLVVVAPVVQDQSEATVDKHPEDRVVHIQFQDHLYHTQVAVEEAEAFHHQHEAVMV